MRLGLLFVQLLLFYTGFSQGASPRNLTDISYNNHPQNTYDLYLPKVYNKNTPVLIMLHGGAWTLGGKGYTSKTSQDLRDSGFVVANIDYRYINENVHLNDLLHDISLAIDSIQVMGRKLGFSTSGYHIAGISAGAHLALMMGYMSKVRFRSISALCAPSDFSDSTFIKSAELIQLVRWLSATPHNTTVTELTLAKISPISNITNVPTLLIHGDKDNLVPVQQSENLEKKLKEKQVESTLMIMAGRGHDVGMNDPQDEVRILHTLFQWISHHN